MMDGNSKGIHPVGPTSDLLETMKGSLVAGTIPEFLRELLQAGSGTHHLT